MKKIELILGLTAILAILHQLKLLPQLSGASALTFYTLSALSLFYCLFGFALFNGIRLRDIFKKTSYTDTNAKRLVGAIALGFTIFTITTGAAFKLLFMSGAIEINFIGLVAMVIILIIALISYLRSRASYYIRVFKRIAIYGVLGLILLFTPPTTLIAIYYSDSPEYVELYKKLQADPENKELRYQLMQMEEEMSDR